MINDDELAGVSEKPSESLSNCDASKATFETIQDQTEGVAPQENATVCDSPAEPGIQPVPVADCPDPASAESDRVDPSATADPSFAASSSLDAIVLEIGQLRASFDEKLRYDGSRDAIIDRLHAELQKHKADLLLNLLKPLALGMIRIHDDMGQMLEAHPVETGLTETAAKLHKLLGDLQVDIEDLLSVNGFESFTVQDTTEFDPKRQRAVQRVPTDDPTLDRQIAKRMRKGFVREDRVVRPEIVAVYVRE